MSNRLHDCRVGQKFVTGSHVIDAEQIVSFARQFDPQPFHLDERAARASPFGGLVASGWHTAAITMRLLVEDGMLEGGSMGAGAEVAWLLPVRPGDALSVECEVTSIEATPSRRDRATLRIETKNQNGVIVQRMIGKLVLPRGEAVTDSRPPDE